MYDPILCMNVPYSVKTKDAEYKMEVTTYVINEGQSGQYYGLKNKKNNQVLHSAPNNWKTKSGAKKWAESKGFVFVEDSKIIDKAIRNCDEKKVLNWVTEYSKFSDLLKKGVYSKEEDFEKYLEKKYGKHGKDWVFTSQFEMFWK